MRVVRTQGAGKVFIGKGFHSFLLESAVFSPGFLAHVGCVEAVVEECAEGLCGKVILGAVLSGCRNAGRLDPALLC